jgi:uncharacterized protein with HEPN domain
VSERSNRYPIADCLEDILDNISRIDGYTAGIDRDALEQDGLRRDAVERCFERICEAAHHLGDRTTVLMPDQPWEDIRGMGNRLRHAYDQIDLAIVWNVVAERLPWLKADAAQALQRLASDGEA